MPNNEAVAQLLALAEQCEKASGPDRGLDAAIALASGWKTFLTPPDHITGQELVWGLDGALGGITGRWRPEPLDYTASIDAALTLLDQYGVLLHLSDIGADGLPLARVGRPDIDEAPIFSGVSSGIAVKATPMSGLALALCAAALRARNTIAEQGGQP